MYGGMRIIGCLMSNSCTHAEGLYPQDDGCEKKAEDFYCVLIVCTGDVIFINEIHLKKFLLPNSAQLQIEKLRLINQALMTHAHIYWMCNNISLMS